MNENNIIDIWVTLRDYFDKKQIDTIASKYVDTLSESGVSDYILKQALGEDSALDSAIEYHLSNSEDEEEELDYESEDWDND